VSGQELIGWGFPQDVALASQLDVSACVPLLREDAYFNSA
jgi:phosphosulfolactate phosphohydrolase-like enzyme